MIFSCLLLYIKKHFSDQQDESLITVIFAEIGSSRLFIKTRGMVKSNFPHFPNSVHSVKEDVVKWPTVKSTAYGCINLRKSLFLGDLFLFSLQGSVIWKSQGQVFHL